MRFSSIAIIFQSASIFVTTLAGTSVDHIDEKIKSFVCNGHIVGHNQFTQYRRLAQNPEYMFKRGSLYHQHAKKLNEARRDVNLQDIPLVYSYSETAQLSFHQLEDMTETRDLGKYVFKSEYFVMVDKHPRSCSILIQEIKQYPQGRYTWPDDISYKLCRVGHVVIEAAT
ncbi:Bgt-51967 [Blumeria graminis f. sp. tritici]|uniref:Bgt-51967 n=1 Tax=Blumeria graminis f. sp. tritici TaxID=62690 RepID=A0A9X9MI82_BLUGR|nr:Bgt-51967 [Blumeria graminis f. sp. tritici]